MLAIQLALDLARQGRKALYVLTQQSREQPAQRARLIMTGWPGSLPDLEQAIFYPSV